MLHEDQMFLYCIFDQINAALVSVFQKLSVSETFFFLNLTDHKLLNM